MAQSNLSLEEISRPPVTWILPKQFGAIMFFFDGECCNTVWLSIRVSR